VRATAAPAAPTTTEPNFVLPATGSSNDSVSWTALVMVLAGLALLVPARRRWLR
jgi:LPXTG-motif cell wall-anchored protein